jgi:hypothetical protein
MLSRIMLCMCVVVVFTNAQKCTFLKGRVLDNETGDGVVGAIVAIKGQWPPFGVVSDSVGDYMLKIYPVSIHTITAFHPYYDTTDVRITFAEPDTWVIDFPLNKRASVDEKYGIITGIVTERKTHKPLIGVDVVISGSQLGAGTGMNGGYVINSVPVGTYILVASYLGYDLVADSVVDVHSGEITVRNFVLKPTQVNVK